MNNRKLNQCIFVLFLAGLLLTGCAGGIANKPNKDIAVCDAYQQLIDVWPNPNNRQEKSSADKIWGAITDAGNALVSASKDADTTDFRETGQMVGEKAVDFRKNNFSSDQIAMGFIPYFDEQLIYGEKLSSLCKSIGRPVTIP
jgi:hypothetical protein